MAFKIIVRERFKNKKIENRRDKIFLALLFLSETVLNTFLPFLSGYYLAIHNSLFWFIPFLLSIIFHIRIDYTTKEIKIEFMRRI